MIRILHIISSLGWGGAQKQLQLLASGLPRDAFEMHVCALAGGPLQEPFRAAGIPTHLAERRWAADPLAFARVQMLIRRLRPDVVHVWDGGCRGFGLAAARTASVPHVVVTERYVGGKNSGPSAVSGRVVRRVDRFVTNHESVGVCLLENASKNGGVLAKKSAVIPQGVPPAPPSDVSRADLCGELAVPSAARLVGVVGRLTPQKRVKDLIWAADLIRVLHDNIRLLIVGEGPQRRHLEQFARGASDLDHIRFLGERADLWRILPHLDVFWHGSGSDGQPLAVMEAMAAGVPAVVSDTPAGRSLVTSGETGYLAAIAGRAVRARCTDRLFRDEALRRRLGEAGRRHVASEFPVARMLDAFAGLYCEVAERQRGGQDREAAGRAA